MRIAVVSPWDAADPAGWSGIVRPLHEALSDRADVVPVRVPEVGDHPLDRAAARVAGARGRGYLPGQALATSRRLARPLSDRVRAARADVVLSVAASTALTYARLDRPVVEVGDTTFRLVTGYYPMFSGLDRAAVWQGEALARRTARRASAFLVSSRWAADSLEADYRVDPGRVVVAPFGPGVRTPSAPEGPRAGAPLRLLFVGSDWARKGGDDAVRVLRAVSDEGVDARLTVVGEAPDLPDGVLRLGRVPREEMPDVYTGHDVLLETAVANAGGVTLTDASAAGLPVVATRTGGVADIVEDGVSGVLVDPARLVPEAVAAVTALADPGTWSPMSRAARRRGGEVLSWDRWADTAVALCHRVAAAH